MIYKTIISPTYRVTGIIAYLLDDEVNNTITDAIPKQ